MKTGIYLEIDNNMTQQEIFAAFDAILTMEASGDYVNASKLLACINKGKN